MNYIIGYIIFHIMCGVLQAGINFAYFQGKYPTLAEEGYRSDLGFAYGLGLLFGPLALLVSVFMSGFAQYGVKFK